MRIIAVVAFALTLAGCASASSHPPAVDSMNQRIEACGAPLIKLEAAINAKSVAEEEYVEVYAAAKPGMETAKAALAKVDTLSTAALVLGYQLAGATPESISKLESAENALNSDIEYLLNPATKLDKASFQALIHKTDADGANVEAIEKTMNISLGIPPNATTDDVDPTIGRLHNVTISDVLLARSNECYAKLRHEIQMHEWSNPGLIPVPIPINLSSQIEQQHQIQQGQLEQQQLQKQLRELQKLQDGCDKALHPADCPGGALPPPPPS